MSGADLRVDAAGDGVEIEVRVAPRASRSAVLGVHAGALKVALTAPPVDGRANEALLALLAEWLGVPKARVRLVRGQTARQKRVRLEGLDADAVRRRVEAGSG